MPSNMHYDPSAFRDWIALYHARRGPMTPERLEELAKQDSAESAMTSGCSDYACFCHAKVPELVAEIRRLQKDAAHWEALATRMVENVSVYQELARGTADGLRVRGRSVSTDVVGCARCGGEHPGLLFDEIPGQRNPHYSHWAMCPTTGHPILMLSLEGNG